MKDKLEVGSVYSLPKALYDEARSCGSSFGEVASATILSDALALVIMDQQSFDIAVTGHVVFFKVISLFPERRTLVKSHHVAERVWRMKAALAEFAAVITIFGRSRSR